MPEGVQVGDEVLAEVAALLRSPFPRDAAREVELRDHEEHAHVPVTAFASQYWQAGEPVFRAPSTSDGRR